MEHEYHDGGRENAGYKGEAGDCVTRSISIATGQSYKKVYEDLHKASKEYSERWNCKVARGIKKRGASPRNGVYREIYEDYLYELGWEWIPTMKIGSGCTVHLRKEELPKGILITRLSRHLSAVIDGVIYDTYDTSREGTRCVYGYFKKKDTQ